MSKGKNKKKVEKEKSYNVH